MTLFQKFFGNNCENNKRKAQKSKKHKGPQKRGLRFEPLESREMLAFNWANFSAFNEVERVIAPLKENVNVYTEIFESTTLPFIGNNLGKVGNNANNAYAAGKQAIYTAFDTIESAAAKIDFTISSAHEFIAKLEAGLGATVVPLLDKAATTVDQLVSVVEAGTEIYQSSIEFKVNKTVSTETFWIDVDVNFGLPGLGMKIDEGAKLGIQFDVAVDFILGYETR